MENGITGFIDLSNLRTVELGSSGVARTGRHSSGRGRSKDHESEDDEELLKWSARLDYDSYVEKWNRVGLSLDSAGKDIT